MVCSAGLTCCGVGSGKPVSFGDQSNIIVWNAQAHTEHFVRSAFFYTDASNLGFIAPSPSKPDLSEADPKAFDLLDSQNPVIKSGQADSAAGAAKSDVEIVQEKDVAGYHATTVLASDSDALASWMKKNGYVTSPGIQTWTQKYVSKGWFLTLFKVAAEHREASIGTVRMSFKTDAPFNPFYVPNDNIDPKKGSTLKVYFVSEGAYEPQISGKLWQDPKWSNGLDDKTADTLAKDLKLSRSDLPASPSVEMFQDAFPQTADDDIYFRALPFPIFATSIFALIFIGAFVVLGFMIRDLRRKNQAGTQ